MPNISKINALDIGSVSKVDGLAKASILDIDGVAVPSATGFLIDYPGAQAAYSVRQLLSTVTVAMRVRRDTAGGTGDDDEADVAFDTSLATPIISLDSAISNASAGVTATTLGQFLNVGTVGGTTYTNPDSLTVTASCYVDTWYDQAGSYDVEQATYGSQPQIHDGTVNTDLITENGKPAIEFDGTDDYLPRTQNDLYITAPWAVFITCTNINNSNNRILIGSAARPYIQLTSANKLNVLIQPDGITQASATAEAQQLFTVRYSWSDSVMDIHVDGSLTDSATPTVTSTPPTDGRTSIGSYFSGAATQPYYGTMQEVVIFGVHENNTNRTAIEGNIMTYFSIP